MRKRCFLSHARQLAPDLVTPPPCPTHYKLERPRRISCRAPATPMMTDCPIRVRMTLTLPMPSKGMVDLIATAGLLRLGSGGP